MGVCGVPGHSFVPYAGESICETVLSQIVICFLELKSLSSSLSHFYYCYN